jgi:hypothetical protein
MNDLLYPVASRPGRRDASADDRWDERMIPPHGRPVHRKRVAPWSRLAKPGRAAENEYVRSARIFPALAAVLGITLAACSKGHDTPTAPAMAARSWRMGFSAIPPRPDFPTLLATLDLWTRRADAAIIHVEPPWDSLLAGTRADSIVRRQLLGLADYYRAKHLQLVFTLDATNGLDRAAESAALVAAGRSITEPAVQRLYRDFAVAVDTLLHPPYLGLGAETNLVRAAAPASVYAALVQMTGGAAAEVRSVDSAVKLYVSVQVETAWGRLPGGSTFVGIATDLADFPFAQVIGLSSYPYLGGFAEPEDLPLDYYARLTGLPELVVEGGWPSDSIGALSSSPAKQGRYLRRQAELLDRANAVAVFQLTFTDLDPAYFPPGSILPLFATLGLVDVNLAPKPALATWDSAFARPRSGPLFP